MASKRRLRRRECEHKRRYDTQEEAAAEAFNTRDRSGGVTNGGIRPYPCPHCHGWHVGHPPGAWRRTMFKFNGRGRRRPGITT